MFYDNNLANIFKRATGVDDQSMDLLVVEYMKAVSSKISDAVIDFHNERGTLPPDLNTIEAITKFIEDNLIDQDEELSEFIQDQLVEFNAEYIKKFCEIASPGDVMYLKVYLASELQKES